MPPHALELFAGIGGNALALKASGFKTVGYCEIEPWCRSVLRSNIGLGRLDNAPLFEDIRELKGHHIKKRVDIIAGGFPCLGVSKIGKLGGLYGNPHSALVKHVYRLIDELQPHYVFLENSPNIINDPNFSDLLRQFKRRDFTVSFMVRSASQLGAVHQRARWFLLAQKKDAKPLRFPSGAQTLLQKLFRQKVPNKTMERYQKSAERICFSFGNTVVPVQAYSAFQDLYATLTAPTTATKKMKLTQIHRWKPTIASDDYQFWQDPIYEVPGIGCGGSGFTVYPPTGVSGTRHRVLPSLKKNFFSQCIPTARTRPNCCVPGVSMTRRSAGDAGSFLLSSGEMYPSKKVPSDEVRRKLQVSDSFWATTLGFPKDWILKPLQNWARSHSAD